MVNNTTKYTTFPKIKDITVKLSIDHTIKPVKQPLRRIPIAVEAQVEEKLKEALQNDIIEHVTGPSEWISPIVVIFKPGGDIRLCVDMRRANQAILRENYPLPTFESFMTKLKNAKLFSKLDLVSAYHQLELHEESRAITTFITHKGMFRYKRLMFGVNSAPEIFQRTLEGILSPCENCLNYLDDIIVFGSTEEEHDRCLANVLDVLHNHNILLNDNKCLKKVKEVKFLGHKLSAEGIDADDRKVETIINFRPPTTKEEVRSFLGLVTYLGKFIPDLGTTTEFLRQLMKHEAKFTWTEAHQTSFNRLKNALAKLPTLSYFDPNLRTRLVADASPVALGAVLLQFDEQQCPHVISFASKSLSDTERRYSQTEKESLALVWGVERFYFYLSGLDFELVTDHKPLEVIFKPTSKPPARIERWLLRLQSFKFKIIYQSGKSNIADSVSRLCQIAKEGSFDQDSDGHIFTIIEKSIPKALSISDIVTASKEDDEIRVAVGKINQDSWETTEKNIYFPFRWELTSLGPMILRGNKIVIPQTLRQRTLELAHEGHPGETVMKRRLRAKVWWPGIDRETENFVKRCRDCLTVAQPNRPPFMSRHKFPEGPWQYLAVDLMGPLPNQEMVFVVIDYYSRYQEIKFLKQTTSIIIIKHLTEIFSRLGFPKSIRADNGRQFVSQEFKTFCKNNNITLMQTPPYWPQANGEVENMNRSILKRLQIGYSNGMDLQNELHKFTLMHNVTPHGTTGKSPSELMFGRNIKDKIPSITDIDAENVNEEARDSDILKKQKGKEKEDIARRAIEDNIQTGDKVLVKNMVVANELVPRFDKREYEVLRREGNELTLIRDSKIVKRHVSHTKKVSQEESLERPSTREEESTTSERDQAEADQGSQNTTIADANPPTGRPSHPDQSRVEPLKLIRKEGLWRPAISHKR
ncbi:uncharacterized protein K02A2.6-like [Coccinella septempunctata]|uniref:uncharacterized protein K02A2.6-like n=1 Tax=Coccinella septempunctata TaxID=41139 RepID=UPI001D07D900|nr:uncharacterized protein K02A2.6-like [Coccinella septempunctata]